MSNEKFENMLSEFLEESGTTHAYSKPCYRIRARKGIRKKNLNIKRLQQGECCKNVCVKLKVKSPTKKYYQIKAVYGIDDRANAELKKECNRFIRRNCGYIPDGSIYKRTVVKDCCTKRNAFINREENIMEATGCDECSEK